MLTPRFIKDIHDMQFREIAQARSRRDDLPESEKTRLIRNRALRRWATVDRGGQLARACE